MNLKDLQNMVSDGESERLEFKASTGQRTQAAKTVCALLNGLGGFVLFGFSDKGKMIREDQPWYPPRATREAIANALCHRDYCIPGGAVAVAMYDDHLEITNPGGLHFGITPEKLTGPHESRPWNPILANVFYRAGIIERWGTGTLNIIDWCADNGNPQPEWSERAGSLVVTFKSAYLSPEKQVADEVTGEVTPTQQRRY